MSFYPDDSLPSFNEIEEGDEVGPTLNSPTTAGEIAFRQAAGLRAEMPPASPLEYLMGSLSNIRVPGEVKERIMPMLQMAAQYQAARDQGMAMQEKRQRAMAMEAEAKQRGLYAEIDKPLPIDAAKMALNKAVGYFAESLAPGKGIKNAEARRAEEIGLLKERRIQRLRTMEHDAQRAMARADELGDQVAKEKAMREAEKAGQQIEIVRGGMKDYYEKRDRQELLTQQIQGRQDEIRLGWVRSVLGGRGSAKLTPEQSAQLKMLDNTYKAKIDGLDNQLKALADDFSMETKDRDAKKTGLIKDRADLIQEWMEASQQIIGVAPQTPQAPVTPPPSPNEATHDILFNMMDNDDTPQQLQKKIAAAPEAFAADFGIEVTDEENMKAAQAMVMKGARQIHTIKQKIFNNIRAINHLRETAGGSGGPRAVALITEIEQLNGQLRQAGLPTIPGTPGSETAEERSGRLREEGQEARLEREQLFRTPTLLN